MTGILCSSFIIVKLSIASKGAAIILFLAVILIVNPKVLNKFLPILISKIKNLLTLNNANTNTINTIPWSYADNLQLIGLYLVYWIGNAIVIYLAIIVFEPVDIQSFPVILSAASLI